MEIRPARWDDLDAVCELLSTRSRVVYGISDVLLEHVRAQWELPSFVVGLDHWVAVEDGRMVGYSALSPSREIVHVADDDGVGAALLAAVLKRAGARKLGSVRAVVSAADAPLHSLLVRRGFELETEILRMWKTLDGSDPDPVWPGGVTVRTYEPNDAAAVKRLLDEAYGAWDQSYVPMTLPDWLRWMTEGEDFDPDLWWLAESDRRLVGCALHWRSGWVKDLAVSQTHRGRGIATSLLREGFRALTRRGRPRVGLKVDARNPTGAIRLYEQLGFVVDRREELRTLCL